eukprot:2911580-Pyramimonas_sp.AAC.2
MAVSRAGLNLTSLRLSHVARPACTAPVPAPEIMAARCMLCANHCSRVIVPHPPSLPSVSTVVILPPALSSLSRVHNRFIDSVWSSNSVRIETVKCMTLRRGLRRCEL